MKYRTRVLGLILGLGTIGHASFADAHWCDTMWQSVYNVVVRPASDTVIVDQGTSAQLQVWVQNNMGYPLGYPSDGFALRAEAENYTIAVSQPSPPATLPGFILPGEKLGYWLTINRDVSGSDDLNVEEITFYVDFGEPREPGDEQDQRYGEGGRDAVIKKTDGQIYPPRSGGEIPDLLPNDSWSRSQHLRSSGHADYGVLDSAMTELLREYCGGKPTWAVGTPNPLPEFCPVDMAGFNCPQCGNCPGATECRDGHCVATQAGYAYTYESLFSAGEIAYRAIRPGVLTDQQLATLRDQLVCAFHDDAFVFKAFATFILGYLGHDGANNAVDCASYDAGSCDGVLGCRWNNPSCDYVGVAFDFLDQHAVDGDSNTTTSEEYICRAALYMMDAVPPSDGGPLNFADEMADCMVSGDNVAEMICAGAAQIRSLDVAAGDDLVQAELINRVSWTYMDDDVEGIFAGHILNLLAWRQRGWEVDAGDSGSVSFYEGVTDEVPPEAPTGVSCAIIGDDTLRVSWQSVTTGEDGLVDVVTDYRVYYGTTPNSCGTCTRPGMGFDYDHVGANVSTTWYNLDPGNLTGGATTYFTVIAIDARGNISQFSAEGSCQAPLPRNAPVADILCSPTRGEAALSVTCDASGSSDQDSNIVSHVFRVQGQDVVGTALNHTFDDPGLYTIQLTVTDATDLWDTADAIIQVDPPGGGNTPPAAVADADVTFGYLPLVVTFNSDTSSDSDGTIASFAWDFDDSSTSTEANPTHTFTSQGIFNVELTVTDDGGLPGSDILRVEVVANGTPDVSSASASPLFGPVPLDVQFDATGAYDPDGDSFTLEWNFGDSSATSSEASVEHTYTTVGFYDAVVTAEDEFGALATRTIRITAGNSPPDASPATVTPQAGMAPLTVRLDASQCTDPDGDDLSVMWSFASGDALDGAVAEYTFPKAGAHIVTLDVTDDGYPPISMRREFTVDVTGGRQIAIGSCGCAGTTGAAWAVVVLVLGFARNGFRRRGAGSV